MKIKKNNKFVVKEFESYEIWYNIYLLFWDFEKLKRYYDTVIDEPLDDDKIAWLTFYPNEWKRIYVYISNYEQWTTAFWKTVVTKKDFYKNTIVHEVTHMVQQMFNYLWRPVSIDEPEPMAYFISYWVNVFTDAIKKETNNFTT